MTPAEVLAFEHGCWSGDAPPGSLPQHAVVTLPGREPTYASADVGFADPGPASTVCPAPATSGRAC